MSLADQFILKVRRGESWPYRVARGFARTLTHPRPGRLLPLLRTPARVLYELHFAVLRTFRALRLTLYDHWLFQGRCATVGKQLRIGSLPFVDGPVQIHIGDGVSLGGNLFIASGRFNAAPQLVLGNHSRLEWNCTITVNQEIVIEEYAMISHHVMISDSDGHRREADLRMQDAPLEARDIKPVRIGRNCWIGNHAHILKGVTIGEGAIIAANSVVMTDIPAFSIAMGNPAEVFFRNAGRPSKKPVTEGKD